MNVLFQKIGYYVLGVPVFLSLPFLSLLDIQHRKKILEAASPYLQPITINMLFPGLLKGSADFIEYNLDRTESTKLFLGFAGNNNTPEEAQAILTGLPFTNGVVFNPHDQPCVIVPLLYAPTQQRYLELLSDRVKQYCKKFPLLQELYMIGHSLGAAISLQLIQHMRLERPDLRIYFVADRSFDKLWHVASFRYGSFLADIMQLTFGVLWDFDSQKILDQLKKDPMVECSVYQLIPDEVLGNRALLINKLFTSTQRPPLAWSAQYDHFNAKNTEKLHITPYKDLQQRTDLKQQFKLVRGFWSGR